MQQDLGLKFKVQSSRFRVQGSRFKACPPVAGSKFKVGDSRFKLKDSGGGHGHPHITS
jgi:uncharacterized protein YxjI